MDIRMDIRDRITAVEKMRLGDIADNPRNPKTHPKRQGEAIRGVVSEVGWAGVPLVYSSERLGRLAFVDGHLRKREFPDLTVNVALTDLTDQEADYLLLTFDPIAALAEQDKEKTDALLKDIQSGDIAVQEMLGEIYEELEKTSLSDDDGESGSTDRNLGDTRKQIKPVLYVDEIAIFEQAILLTGEQNRGKAIIQICQEFINARSEG
jgi:hypothetical protein